MKTKQETLEDNRLKVTVTVDEKEVETRINKTYKDLSHRYNFPGFRRGHVPQQVINNALGTESVLATVTETLINETYPQVIEEDDLYPLGQASFEDDGSVQKGKPYTYSFTVEVKPQLELSSYDPVSIELPGEGASDAEIEEQIEILRSHYDDFKDASAATKLKAENYAELAIKATDESGNDIGTLSSESRLYGPGTGMFSEAFDKEVLGMKKGESKTFTLDVPLDETAVLLAPQAGNKITFEVTCKVVKNKTVPELTDEWVKNTLGFDDIAGLRQGISDSVAMQKTTILPRLKETRCLDALVERLQGDAPASMTEEAETRLLQDFFSQLQMQGTTFDVYLKQQDMTADDFKADMKEQAELTAKQELALDAWARHYDIKATPEEVTGEFVRAGLEKPEEVEREWRESGRLYLVREGVVRGKAANDLMEKAVVTEVDYAEADAEKKAASEKATKSTKSTTKKAASKSTKTSTKKSAAKEDDKTDEAAEKAEKPAAKKKTAAKAAKEEEPEKAE